MASWALARTSSSISTPSCSRRGTPGPFSHLIKASALLFIDHRVYEFEGLWHALTMWVHVLEGDNVTPVPFLNTTATCTDLYTSSTHLQHLTTSCFNILFFFSCCFYDRRWTTMVDHGWVLLIDAARGRSFAGCWDQEEEAVGRVGKWSTGHGCFDAWYDESCSLLWFFFFVWEVCSFRGVLYCYCLFLVYIYSWKVGLFVFASKFVVVCRVFSSFQNRLPIMPDLNPPKRDLRWDIISWGWRCSSSILAFRKNALQGYKRPKEYGN